MGNIFFETWFLSSVTFAAPKSFPRMIIKMNKELPEIGIMIPCYNEEYRLDIAIYKMSKK